MAMKPAKPSNPRIARAIALSRRQTVPVSADDQQLTLETLHLHSRPVEQGATGVTMAVARERHTAVSDTAARTGIITAQEVILSSPTEGLSLYALKTLLLLIHRAGGDAWKPEVQHYISKGELIDLHTDSSRVTRTLNELSTREISIATKSPRGFDAVLQQPFLSAKTTEVMSTRNGRMYYKFSEALCFALQNSDSFGEVNKLIALSLRSTYSLKLYEIGTLFFRRRVKSWEVTVEDFRKQLGVPEGAYSSWTELERRVLRDPVAEVNQLAPFAIGWAASREGRGGRVAAVTINFRPKGDVERDETTSAVESAVAKRRSRRTENNDQVADAATSSESPTLQTYARRLDKMRARGKSVDAPEIRQSCMPPDIEAMMADLRKPALPGHQATISLGGKSVDLFSVAAETALSGTLQSEDDHL